MIQSWLQSLKLSKNILVALPIIACPRSNFGTALNWSLTKCKYDTTISSWNNYQTTKAKFTKSYTWLLIWVWQIDIIFIIFLISTNAMIHLTEFLLEAITSVELHMSVREGLSEWRFADRHYRTWGKDNTGWPVVIKTYMRTWGYKDMRTGWHNGFKWFKMLL